MSSKVLPLTNPEARLSSEDLRRKERTWAGVKARGRWRSEASVRRYGKEAKLLTELKKVPAAKLAEGEEAEKNLRQHFMEGRHRWITKQRLALLDEDPEAASFAHWAKFEGKLGYDALKAWLLQRAAPVRMPQLATQADFDDACAKNTAASVCIVAFVPQSSPDKAVAVKV